LDVQSALQESTFALAFFELEKKDSGLPLSYPCCPQDELSGDGIVGVLLGFGAVATRDVDGR